MDIKKSKGIMVVLLLFVFPLSLCQDYEDDELRPSWGRCPWIRNKLKNGRVKIRSRGRIAKFLCNSGYEMVGKRFATCVRGQWNNPLPVCVNRGCYKISEPANGRVSETYRGAVMDFDCFPGYILQGASSLYCDGSRWSDMEPVCAVAISQPQTSCDFEDPDLCGWTHDPSHDFDWRRNQFGTPSGHVGTGPSYDHTFGKGKAGFYMYEEVSTPRKLNDTSRLFSPVFPSLNSPGCFVFWYHMYGYTTGGLRVYVKPESQVFGEFAPSWEKYGDQGNQWLRGNMTIPYLTENFQLIIEGIRGTSYVGDMAIDDVTLLQTECNALDSMNSSSPEVSQDSCRGRCRENEDSVVCECTEQCTLNNTCCSDYSKICTTGNETFVWESEIPEDIIPTDHSVPVMEIQTVEYQTTGIITSTNSHDASSVIAASFPESTTLRETAIPFYSSTTDFIPSFPTSVPKTELTEQPSINKTPAATKINTDDYKSTASRTTQKATTMPPIPTITTDQQNTAKSTTAKTTIMLTTNSFEITEQAALTSLEARKTTKILEPTKISPMITQSLTTEKTTRDVVVPGPTTKYPISTSVVTKPSFVITPNITSTKEFLTTDKTTTLPVNPPIMTIVSTAQLASTSTQLTTSTPMIATQAHTNVSDMNSTPPTKNKVTTSSTISEDNSSPSTNIASKSVVFTPNSVSTVSPMVFTTLSFPRTTSIKTTQKRRTIYILKIGTTEAVSSPTPQYITEITTRKRLIEKTSSTTTSLSYLGLEESTNAIRSSKLPARADDNSSSSVAGVTVGILVSLCLVGGLGYFFYRRRNRKLTALSEDSEIRFLSNNEVLEFSDASVFDKMILDEMT